MASLAILLALLALQPIAAASRPQLDPYEPQRNASEVGAGVGRGSWRRSTQQSFARYTRGLLFPSSDAAYGVGAGFWRR